jgi:hypothetical protein
MKLIEWITQSPPAVLTLTVAFVSASVAFLTAIITQVILSRRAKRELLIKKLEELYLVLNEAASHCVNRYVEVRKCHYEPELATSDDFYLHFMHGLDVQKKIIMYVRLYFPRLSLVYEDIAKAQNQMQELEKGVMSGTNPTAEEVEEVFKKYGKCLAVMEAMIVSNRALLTGSFWVLRRYRPPANNGMHPTADTTALM